MFPISLRSYGIFDIRSHNFGKGGAGKTPGGEQPLAAGDVGCGGGCAVPRRSAAEIASILRFRALWTLRLLTPNSLASRLLVGRLREVRSELMSRSRACLSDFSRRGSSSFTQMEKGHSTQESTSSQPRSRYWQNSGGRSVKSPRSVSWGGTNCRLVTLVIKSNLRAPLDVW